MDLELTLYSPHKKQEEAHEDGARFKVLNWGRRTGKSTFAINHTLLNAFQTVGRYWIVAPTYRQVKNIYWRDIVSNHIPEELIQDKNEAELIVKLINGSTIELKGSENENSLRGAGIKGVILDEYAFMNPDSWEFILRPALADSKGWAIFISTPNGFNHFYDIAQFALGYEQTETGGWKLEHDGGRENWFYSHATSYDNTYLDPSEIDAIKQGTEESVFAQEYMAEFRKMAGLVYKDFERSVHVVSPKTVPYEGTHAVGIDFGYTNPLAAIFVRIDFDGTWWVYDEVYRPGLVTEEAVDVIQDKMGQNYFNYVIGDSAAAQEIANFNMAGLQVKPCSKTKDSIQAGIRIIAEKLKVKGNGKPSMYISANCTHLISEFETYHYEEGTRDRNGNENPVKDNDHALDALRYLALTIVSPNKIKFYKPPAMVRAKQKTRV